VFEVVEVSQNCKGSNEAASTPCYPAVATNLQIPSTPVHTGCQAANCSRLSAVDVGSHVSAQAAMKPVYTTSTPQFLAAMLLQVAYITAALNLLMP
jgi:hypothetical protein